MEVKVRDLVEVVKHLGKDKEKLWWAFEERESKHGGRSCLPHKSLTSAHPFQEPFHLKTSMVSRPDHIKWRLWEISL